MYLRAATVHAFRFPLGVCPPYRRLRFFLAHRARGPHTHPREPDTSNLKPQTATLNYARESFVYTRFISERHT